MENKTITVKYNGMTFDVYGEYEPQEEETGFKGGFSWRMIKINDVDVSDMLNDVTIDIIVDLAIFGN
jgi:hypothetical protein